MSVPDIVISQVAKAAGDVIAGVTGSAIAGSAVGATLTLAESINLYNNLKDGTATVGDVLAVTTALEAALLGAGVALTAAGAIAGIGASIPIVSAALIAGAIYTWYERNGIAAQDSAAIIVPAIRDGKQPWTFIPEAIDAYRKSSYKRNIFPDVNNNWRNAITPPRRDPLAIDLDGDGIETVGIPATGSPILFDHDADGVRTGTGWLKGDDAWLVLDRNGNGTIDSGRELFGADTIITVTEPILGTFDTRTVTRNARSGFEALRSVDTGNGTAGSAGFGDGVFDSKDAAFTQVKLWQDQNQDGISQSNELFSLADKGITSINLNASTASTNLGNGNTVTGQATVTRSNGTTTVVDSVDLQASNLNLADNPFCRQFSDTIPLTAAAKALPEMGGNGWLRDIPEWNKHRTYGCPSTGAISCYL